MDEKVTAKRLLELLQRQGHRCALTGRELTPATAVLDHVTPTSRGGLHVVSNVQVIHTDVNQAKYTMTQHEFIELCREVVAHAGDQMGQRARA